MDVKIIIIITAVLLSSLIGLAGYWLKSVYREFKQLLKELTAYINELKQIVVSIQTQIEKGIEADIGELKADIETLYQRTNKLQNQISVLNQKCKVKE